MYENLSHERYTPVEGKVKFLFDRLHREYGSWDKVADAVPMSRRYFRTIRNDRITVSESVLDRILSACSTATTVADFEWYTTDELVAKGLWKPTPSLPDFIEGE